MGTLLYSSTQGWTDDSVVLTNYSMSMAINRTDVRGTDEDLAVL